MNYVTLVAPVNTEKAMSLTALGVYTFWIADFANKNSVKKEVEEIFKVKVSGVNIVCLPAKKRIFKGITGKITRLRKALVTVSEGSINFEKGF